MPLPGGTRLGAYEIVASLGAGGMGEVYRAIDTRLGREVAVKVIAERLSDDPSAVARFEREAKAVAALSHPNILALHDFGREGGVTFAVMELLQGETLAARLATEQFTWRRSVEIAAAIADGLASAHARGIVHHDLKPANVFITRDGLVKILDFGLATREPYTSHAAAGLASASAERSPESSTARSGTCRRNRSTEPPAINEATSSRSAASCTKCWQVGPRSAARRRTGR